MCKLLVCYPLEIIIIIIINSSSSSGSSSSSSSSSIIELLGETRIIILIIIIRAGTPFVRNPFHVIWNPKYIEFWDQYILVSN